MKIYIAGPMTGLPEFNYPAFRAAAEQLAAEGHDVEDPSTNVNPMPADYHGWLRAGLRQLIGCEGVALLPGWEASGGARLEASVAATLGLRVAPLAEWLPTPRVIDAAHLARQRTFSAATFGPGARTSGVIDHIRKELREIAADPADLTEWVDVVILAFDGAWRAGWEPQQIIDAIHAKQERNEARAWPDWRTADPTKAIEHIRTEAVSR